MSTQIIILAGGQGKRMGGDLPKALHPLKGKPMISYLLESIKRSGICPRPVIVVGSGSEIVKKTFGSDYDYIFQSERLGTGHAVKICKEYLQGKSEHIMVLYADQPFVSSDAIQNLNKRHNNTHATMSLMTVIVSDFEDWRETFYSYGRVTRKNGEIFSIVELKDCSDEEKLIKEVSPSFFCFCADWLWENIEKLSNNNAQKEFYLTDMLMFAVTQNKKVECMQIDPRIAIGINTPAQLEKAEKLMF